MRASAGETRAPSGVRQFHPPRRVGERGRKKDWAPRFGPQPTPSWGGRRVLLHTWPKALCSFTYGRRTTRSGHGESPKGRRREGQGRTRKLHAGLEGPRWPGKQAHSPAEAPLAFWVDGRRPSCRLACRSQTQNPPAFRRSENLQTFVPSGSAKIRKLFLGVRRWMRML